LFAPGNRGELVEKALRAGADAVVLDLEDAVPQAEKAAAREIVASALRQARAAEGPRVFVRINGVTTADWEADLHSVVLPGLDGIRLAKAEAPEDVERVDSVLNRLESERGRPLCSVELTLTIESAVGVEAAAALARTSRRVRNLCFGAVDFAADVGADPGPDGLETLYARSRLVLASRAARLDPPIAAAHVKLDDEAGLAASSEAYRRLGFFGRSCVHPRQVPVVNAVFQPSPDEVARARRLVEVQERAETEGRGTSNADGELVDRAVLRRARAVLALAVRFGERRGQ
jgi:citrate lyase subunit beta/citryl-CoA lyase